MIARSSRARTFALSDRHSLATSITLLVVVKRGGTTAEARVLLLSQESCFGGRALHIGLSRRTQSEFEYSLSRSSRTTGRSLNSQSWWYKPYGWACPSTYNAAA